MYSWIGNRRVRNRILETNVRTEERLISGRKLVAGKRPAFLSIPITGSRWNFYRVHLPRTNRRSTYQSLEEFATLWSTEAILSIRIRFSANAYGLAALFAFTGTRDICSSDSVRVLWQLICSIGETKWNSCVPTEIVELVRQSIQESYDYFYFVCHTFLCGIFYYVL